MAKKHHKKHVAKLEDHKNNHVERHDANAVRHAHDKNHLHQARKKDGHIQHGPQTPEESLRYIYKLDVDRDEEVDMSKLEIMRTPIVRRILLSMLLVLIAVSAGLAGTVLLNNPFDSSQKESLTFDIQTASDGIVSGKKTEIKIPYNNPGSVPLADLELTVHLPDSFVLDSTSAEPIEQSPLKWKIGSLGPNESGNITVTGTFFEKPGTAVTIQTISRYTPSNFSSSFEDIVSKSIVINESIFSTSVSGPDRSVPGEPQEYTIAVEHNNADEVQESAVLRLDLPVGFVITESSIPTSEENKPVWNMESLADADVFELKIKGTFASDVQGKQEILSVVGVDLNGKFVEQARGAFASTVIASDFAISLVVNGQTGGSIILPGDDITVNVALNNRGEETSEDMYIELFVDSGLSRVDLAGRSGIPNGDVHGNKINWDGTDLNRLETLRGGENASIDLSIPTNDDGPTTIVLHAEATIKKTADLEINRTIKSSSITIQIASDVRGSSSAVYYNADGSSVGSGPMPPKVGQETMYRVTWSVVNGLNDVQDLVMVAPIPSDSKWGGLVSSTNGTLHYDAVANRVRWSLGGMSAGAVPPVAVFDMKVNPRTADIGTFLDLLGPVSITAFDTVTGAQVSSTVPPITSELPNDTFADNKGVVSE